MSTKKLSEQKIGAVKKFVSLLVSKKNQEEISFGLISQYLGLAERK